jgi:pilus assembly protein Flp/PilA
MPAYLTRLFFDEKGQGMTEYGLVLGVIAMGVLVVIYACRQQITALFQARLDNLKDNVPSPK